MLLRQQAIEVGWPGITLTSELGSLDATSTVCPPHIRPIEEAPQMMQCNRDLPRCKRFVDQAKFYIYKTTGFGAEIQEALFKECAAVSNLIANGSDGPTLTPGTRWNQLVTLDMKTPPSPQPIQERTFRL